MERYYEPIQPVCGLQGFSCCAWGLLRGLNHLREHRGHRSKSVFGILQSADIFANEGPGDVNMVEPFLQEGRESFEQL